MINSKNTSNFLPEYLQSRRNRNFLSATLDQLVKKPSFKRVNGYYGSKSVEDFNISDVYLGTGNYDLTPALVTSDAVIGFDDLSNYIETILPGSDYNDLFNNGIKTFDPGIDWDKLINYDQYIWMPQGPAPVNVEGTQLSVNTIYSVTDSGNGQGVIFTPDGINQNPYVTLYRGFTYVFRVKSSYTISIKTAKAAGPEYNYSQALNNSISSGIITMTVDQNTPTRLFYVAEENLQINGQILIQDVIENSQINVSLDIVGQPEYTSPSGVVFTNGLKVTFHGSSAPDEYGTGSYYVEGVGSAIRLIPENALDATGLKNTVGQTYAFDATNFDQYPFDDFRSIPLTPEYVVINRGSNDLNPWTRVNRWFHVQVINYVDSVNGTTTDVSSFIRAQRPILEYRSDIQLYNFRSSQAGYADYVDTTNTDVFNTVEGAAGYVVDQISLQDGDRIIFVADENLAGQVYEVRFTVVGTSIRLGLIPSTILNAGQGVFIRNGVDYAGSEWHFDGIKWIKSQARKSINQAPLFDLFDNSGISFSNQSAYPNSTFSGNALLSYSSTGTVFDAILGLYPAYQNGVVGIGTILFTNHYDEDSFTALESGNTVTYQTKSGSIRDILGNSLKVWNDIENYRIPVCQIASVPAVGDKIEFNSIQSPWNFQELYWRVDVLGEKLNDNLYTVTNEHGKIYFTFPPSSSDRVVQLECRSAGSLAVANLGFWQLPIPFAHNPTNLNLIDVSFSSLSDHATSSVKALTTVIGDFPGNNNSRDIHNIVRSGTQLLKNESAPFFCNYFLRNSVGLADRITETSNQFKQWKYDFLSSLVDLNSEIAAYTAVDLIIKKLSIGKNTTQAYALSDMIPSGTDYEEIFYTATNNPIKSFTIPTIFSLIPSQTGAVLVYINELIALYGVDYHFESDQILIDANLTAGQTIRIRYYPSTSGNFIPQTPTKLGLFPAFTPRIEYDNSYVDPTYVIIGHDGSRTPVFGDYRDQIILELESRIFNNIKTPYDRNRFDINDSIPGAFRQDSRRIAVLLQSYSQAFLNWAGQFGIDLTDRSDFDQNNSLTWNYRQSSNSLGITDLPGHWRGIYELVYGTDIPHISPWEMLGFSDRPNWWESTYGTAPYTRDNSILWSDLEIGNIRSGQYAGINSKYARPGLSKIIPVDENGNLLDPVGSGVITQVNLATIDDPWIFGDRSPKETAWRRSSFWPFAVQYAMSICTPLQYCGLGFDTSRILKFNDDFLYDGTFSTPSTVDFTVSSSTSGYLTWIYNQYIQESETGYQSLINSFNNLTYNLTIKLAGFSDPDVLDVAIDSVSPSTTNPGRNLSKLDFSIRLDSGLIKDSISVSGLIIQRTGSGFVLKGYDTQIAYFESYPVIHTTLDSTITAGGVTESYVDWIGGQTNGARSAPFSATAVQNNTNSYYAKGQIVRYQNNFYRVQISHLAETVFDPSFYIRIPSLPVIGGVTAKIASDFDRETINRIPYGTEFGSYQEVIDFIVGMAQILIDRGLIFDEFNQNTNSIMNWVSSARDFLYWTTQKWAQGSIIVLSPFASTLKFQPVNSVVLDLYDPIHLPCLLQQDGRALAKNHALVDRDSDTGLISISTRNTPNGIFFARLNTTQIQHVLVLNSQSLYGDTIYDSTTGYRQNRVKLIGSVTDNWSGGLQTPGFIYDSAIVTTWRPGVRYYAGQVVEFTGKYYSSIYTQDPQQQFQPAAWRLLLSKPTPTLYPNLDYKASEFLDFYSTDILDFDHEQQKFSQHLIGYSPRSYLTNVFADDISQYKFYQGFIRDKGTTSVLNKLSKSTLFNNLGDISYSEDWAIRVGDFGGVTSLGKFETVLNELNFSATSQIVKFVDNLPAVTTSTIYYQTSTDITESSGTTSFPYLFSTSTSSTFLLPMAGYVHYSDVLGTVFDELTLQNIRNNADIKKGDVVWMGFPSNRDWDTLRYNLIGTVTTVTISSSVVTIGNFNTVDFSTGSLISLVGFNSDLDGIYTATSVTTNTISIQSPTTNISTTEPLAYGFRTARFDSFSLFTATTSTQSFSTGDLIWIDSDISGGWAVYQYSSSSTWQIYRTEPTLYDSEQLVRAILYDNQKSLIKTYLDVIDIAKSKLPGEVTGEISITSPVDPAIYNVGTTSDTVDPVNFWADQQIGLLWWDLENYKTIWYEQGDDLYRNTNWNTSFPGSQVEIYEWVRSPYLPSQWASMADTPTGLTLGISGQPKSPDNSKYTIKQFYDQATGAMMTVYYYWVKNPSYVDPSYDRKISANSIAALISDPKTSATPQLYVLNSNTIAVGGGLPYLNGTGTSLILDFDSNQEKILPHSQWHLLSDGLDNSLPPEDIKNKIIDSLVGIDITGNPIPANDLKPLKPGIGLGQSVFWNRLQASEELFQYVNSILNDQRISTTRDLTTLIIDNNLWSYKDWTSSDFDSAKILEYTGDSIYQLEIFSYETKIGDYVKIKNQGNGTYIILERTDGLGGTWDLDWNIVYSEKGTISFLMGCWDGTDNPTNLRNVLTVIINNILISDLSIYLNQFWFTLIKYIMSEQSNPDWIFKTAFLNIQANAGSLDQRSTYKLNNVDFFQSYLEEAKPYHTKIRKLKVGYTTYDESDITSTDFDLISKYDPTISEYTNPLDVISTSEPWNSWHQNVGMHLTAIKIIDGGSNYQSAPTVTVVPKIGDTGTGATAVAYLKQGSVYSVEVTPGQGYTLTPDISFTAPAAGGTPARAVAVMGDQLNRSIKTRIRYDRVGFTRDITTSTVSDSVIADGSNNRWQLSFVPRLDQFDPAKASIFVTINSAFVSPDQYSIEIEKNNIISSGTNYLGETAFIVFATPPTRSSVIDISYEKSIELYNAVARIQDYYDPSYGMPSKNLADLIQGYSYTGLLIDTVPFSFEQGWDQTGFSGVWDSFDTNNGILTIVNPQDYPDLVVGSNVVITTPFIVSTGTLFHVQVNDSIVDSSITPYPLIGNNAELTATIPLSLFGTGTQILRLVADLSDGSAFLNSVQISSFLTGGTFTNTNTNTLIEIIDGNSFLNGYSSHAPEEMIPGEMRESISIRLNSNSTSTTSTYSYREFIGLTGNRSFKKICPNATTSLAQPLLNSDSNIVVVDGSKLAQPFLHYGKPGVVWINGERIEYGVLSGNILTALNRGTQGTGVAASYPAGTIVEDQGVLQEFQSFQTTTNQTILTSAGQTTYLFDQVVLNTLTTYSDQLTVIFGGTALVKPLPANNPLVTFNPENGFDSGQVNINGKSTDEITSSSYTVYGSASIPPNPVVMLNFDPGSGIALMVSQLNDLPNFSTASNFTCP